MPPLHFQVTHTILPQGMGHKPGQKATPTAGQNRSLGQTVIRNPVPNHEWIQCSVRQGGQTSVQPPLHGLQGDTETFGALIVTQWRLRVGGTWIKKQGSRTRIHGLNGPGPAPGDGASAPIHRVRCPRPQRPHHHQSDPAPDAADRKPATRRQPLHIGHN